MLFPVGSSSTRTPPLDRDEDTFIRASNLQLWSLATAGLTIDIEHTMLVI